MLGMSLLAMKCMLLLAGHFIGDFAFQTSWMAAEKGKDWEVLFYHVATYTLTIGVFGVTDYVTLSGWALLFIFMSHFLIDAMKGRWKMIKCIYTDQACHVSVLVGLVAVGLL